MEIKKKSELVFLIDQLRNTDQYIKDIFLNGGCFQFHLFLKSMIPKCELYITKERNHCVTKFKNSYFDITGEVFGDFEIPNAYERMIMIRWNFASHKALQIGECPVCEEPIVV